jgi:hypothetical protein
MPESIKTPGDNCPSCGKFLDGATGIGESRDPRPGMVSICLYCGHIMAFTDDLRLRELNDEEIKEVAGNPAIIAIQKARGFIK